MSRTASVPALLHNTTDKSAQLQALKKCKRGAPNAKSCNGRGKKGAERLDVLEMMDQTQYKFSTDHRQ